MVGFIRYTEFIDVLLNMKNHGESKQAWKVGRRMDGLRKIRMATALKPPTHLYVLVHHPLRHGLGLLGFGVAQKFVELGKALNASASRLGGLQH